MTCTSLLCSWDRGCLVSEGYLTPGSSNSIQKQQPRGLKIKFKIILNDFRGAEESNIKLCFHSQAEHHLVYLKWRRKENFGRLVRQSQGARTDSVQMGTTVSNIFLHNLFELQLTPSHPRSKDYPFAGIELSSCI